METKMETNSAVDDTRINSVEIDWYRHLRMMQKHHAIFQKLVKLGRPQFSRAVPTAAVSLNKNSKRITFLFNPSFWNELTDSDRSFIIAHECLHLVYRHFDYLTESAARANVAKDITINESLVNYFGFQPSEQLLEKLCFINTVFPGRTDILPNQGAQYYYDLLPENTDKNSIDSHEFGGSPEELQKFLEGNLTQEDFKNIEEKIKKAGSTKGGDWVSGLPVNRMPKQKWDNVIKQWSRKFIFEKDVDQWIMPSRRHTLLDPTLSMQSELTIENNKPERVLVWFFQDYSGSCVSYAERFRTAALSLPAKKFDVRMFSFDTTVAEVSLEKGEVYGGGGTSFSALEQYIQQEMADKSIPYPEAVFVMTDGYGDDVSPQSPKKWHVFLTQGGSSANFPNEVNTYNLEEFE